MSVQFNKNIHPDTITRFDTYAFKYKRLYGKKEGTDGKALDFLLNLAMDMSEQEIDKRLDNKEKNKDKI